MPACGLEGPDGVAADRRRQDLSRRVRDEVGPREPGERLVHALGTEQLLPPPRQRNGGHDHDRRRGREVPEVGVGEDVDRRLEVDLPDEIRDGEPGDEQRQRNPNQPAPSHGREA
jgi:hypothetical protein